MTVLTLDRPPDTATSSSWPAVYPPTAPAVIDLDCDSEHRAHDARLFVQTYCLMCGMPDSVRDAAMQCVSELATNVVHSASKAGSRFSVRCVQLWPFLVVSVRDPGRHLPIPHRFDLAEFWADPDDAAVAGGWGIASICDCLADCFGFRVTSGGLVAELCFACPWTSRRDIIAGIPAVIS